MNIHHDIKRKNHNYNGDFDNNNNELCVAYSCVILMVVLMQTYLESYNIVHPDVFRPKHNSCISSKLSSSLVANLDELVCGQSTNELTQNTIRSLHGL